ncbi:MAG: choice-of-anchor J domain-containing protein [Candidatus Cloacimonetes bacterium]|nr:choice-of-anchor J domain-containing protein [Candidatus Cloacimonadota bacterium]
MKRLFFFILFIIPLLTAFASSVSPERATSIGKDIFAHLSGSAARFSSLETYRGSESQTVDIYILRFEPQGFIILAAEDQSAPILAYSLESSFPSDKLAPHVEWYLNEYSKSITEIRNHPQWAVDPAWKTLERKDFSAYSFNRYFYLNNLNPGSNTFNQYQAAVLNIYPLSTETADPPTNVVATDVNNNINITWQAPGTSQPCFSDGFETYADFAVTFAPWTLVDVDLSVTYGITGTTFPNSGSAMAYIIFNPSATTPAITGLTAFNGAKMAACFAATTSPNNDWMITPQVSVANGDVVHFWAKSHTADYGLERFKVGVSTTGTAPANFTIISGATYVSAPVAWTQYYYDLSAYAGQPVRIGIQCVSNDAFIFLVDDLCFDTPTARGDLVTMPKIQKDLTMVNIRTQNIGNLPAPERRQYNPDAGVVSLAPSIDLGLLELTVPNRALTGYKLWRLVVGQESNEASWTSLTPNAISATTYQDTGWGALPYATYKWAVKAVYTGSILSPVALSNPIAKITMSGSITGIVRNQANQPISGVTITAGIYTATTNASGLYSISVPSGIYSVTATHASYASSTQTEVLVITNQATTLNFVLAPSQNLLVDGFETYADFALTFAPWTCVDVDQGVTYEFAEYIFQNSGAPMAYIIFTPSATTPATDISAHSGLKMAACFAAFIPPQGSVSNNDWLITPQISSATQIKFWAKSYTGQYGLERFKVGVSTTGTAPANFTIISGATYIEAPVDWTEYTYDLSSYETTPIMVGIQCVSNDAFIFFVDDVSMNGNISSGTQTLPLLGGWNLVSLNVSPNNHTISSLIDANVQQIKGSEGVYMPNNPYSTLTTFTDGKAYSIQMSSAYNWNVAGAPITTTTPLALLDGWNMAAYLPQTSLPIATAVQSIGDWLVQVKGKDGIYIPNNPYSTLSTMSPNKGYWININGAHNLVYPDASKFAESTQVNRTDIPVTVLCSSMILLGKCDGANSGDILLARVRGELRGAERFIAPEGFAAVLIQIYTETAGEEIAFSILKADGTELPISTTISSQPQGSIGSYPSFLNLEIKTAGDTPVAVPTSLLGCYPNPFNPSTTISFSIAQDNSPVSIEIFNLKGQKVSTLLNTQLSKGNHSIVWSGKDDSNHSVASGVYFIKMNADGYHKSMKALLSK